MTVPASATPARSRRPRSLEKRSNALWTAYLVVILVVLLAPLGVVVLMSFNTSVYGTLPFHGTLTWYSQLFHGSALLGPTVLSLELAAEVAVTCAVLGTMLAIWMIRYGRRLLRAVQALLVTTMTVPWLILGVAMLVVLTSAGIQRSYLLLFVANVVVLLPYATIVIAARLATLDPSVEDAARSLGASPFAVVLRITAPQLAPAIAAGTILSFVFCFNNFVIQYFLVPFGVETLPLDIYNSVRTGYKPDIDALGTLIIVIIVVLLIVFQRVIGGALVRATKNPGKINVTP
jgi:ABC-type spermidine/putrescine transport system permease subunit II